MKKSTFSLKASVFARAATDRLRIQTLYNLAKIAQCLENIHKSVGMSQIDKDRFAKAHLKAAPFTARWRVSLPPFQWPWEDPRCLWACPSGGPSLERTWRGRKVVGFGVTTAESHTHDEPRRRLLTWVARWPCAASAGQRSCRWRTRSSCVWRRFSPHPFCVCAPWGDRCCVFCPGLWGASSHPGFSRRMKKIEPNTTPHTVSVYRALELNSALEGVHLNASALGKKKKLNINIVAIVVIEHCAIHAYRYRFKKRVSCVVFCKALLWICYRLSWNFFLLFWGFF